MIVRPPQLGTAEVADAAGSGSPRVGVVFRLWQCDKENHGGREGLLQTVLPSSIAWLALTLLISECRTKKEYCFSARQRRNATSN
jgi:hypothetical protein